MSLPVNGTSTTGHTATGGPAVAPRTTIEGDQNLSNKEHEEFCLKLGIDQKNPYKTSGDGFYREIKRACKYHSWQYWFIASLINTLHLLQIIIGATATALGGAGVAQRASKQRTTAITVLTTIMTVIAAILVYFKSRGQPNRVRQLRNDLRKVKEYIRDMERAFLTPADTTTSVKDALTEVTRLYKTARANAETNYPDTWSTSSDTSTKQASVH
jgi:hypothetical protein